MEKEVKVIIKNVGESPRLETIKDDFRVYGELVGGFFSCVYPRDLFKERSICIYLDDEGLLKGLPHNVTIPEYGNIVGNIVFGKVDPFGEGVDLTDEDIDYIMGLDWLK